MKLSTVSFFARFVYLIPIILVTKPIYAYDELDLQKLLTTRICNDCNLIQANLDSKNLNDVSLLGANLREANLVGANLRGAELIGADLTGADLTGVDLTGAFSEPLYSNKDVELACVCIA